MGQTATDGAEPLSLRAHRASRKPRKTQSGSGTKQIHAASSANVTNHVRLALTGAVPAAPADLPASAQTENASGRGCQSIAGWKTSPPLQIPPPCLVESQ